MNITYKEPKANDHSFLCVWKEMGEHCTMLRALWNKIWKCHAIQKQ